MNYFIKNALVKSLFFGVCFTIGATHLLQGMEKIEEKKVNEKNENNIKPTCQQKLMLGIEKYEKKVNYIIDQFKEPKILFFDTMEENIKECHRLLSLEFKNFCNEINHHFSHSAEPLFKKLLQADSPESLQKCVFDIFSFAKKSGNMKYFRTEIQHKLDIEASDGSSTDSEDEEN